MITTVKEAFPFPEERPNFKPFTWKLDGGGRDLMFSLLDRENVALMVEVGVLYGGSCLQWLKHKPTISVVGIDPWDFDNEQVRYWWRYRHSYGLSNLDQKGMSDNDFLEQLLRPDAAYRATLSNLWDYRDRFVPVRGRSPEMLYKLAQLGLTPDLVYFDSDKELSDLWVCQKLWPTAIISGDDWTWSPIDQNNIYPVQEVVGKFAAEHQMEVHSSEATWYLTPAVRSV